MEQMVNALESSFASSRLLYRPMEDTERHNEFMYRHDWADPVINGLSNLATLRPINRQQANERNAWIIKNCLIAIVIVLRPSDDAAQPGTVPQADPGAGSLASDTIIGHLHLTKSSQSSRETSIGLGIANEYQGKGYGREAINWALDYAFRYAGMHRVEIGTISFNERAIALYKSIGFVEEGRKRESAFFNMQWHDYVEMSMLENEYLALRDPSKARR